MACQAVYGELPLNVKFIYEGEEEIGSPHLAEFARKYPQRLKTDGFAWEGGSKQLGGPLEVCFGTKGMLFVELRCRTAASDQHSSKAAIVKNPAWRLVQALATMKDAQDRITIDGFYDRVRSLTNYERECILPAEACVSMDFRLVPDQMPEEIFQCIRAHLDRRGFSDIELVLRSAEPPYRADPQSLFGRTVIRCVKPVYGIDPEVFAGAADTTALYQFCHGTGLDAVLFGAGNDGANIHAPNENIILEDYINAIKLAATVMEEFALAKPED